MSKARQSAAILRIIERLPTMKMNQIMNLWRNALKYEESGPSSPYFYMARPVIDAIRNEWLRRGKLPPDPEEYFGWPSTDAFGGNGRLSGRNWQEEGVLKYMGYQVGRNSSLSTKTRQNILSETLDGPLPPVFPPQYLREWAEPKSPRRLMKMAESLAAFTRNAKRRDPTQLRDAIRNWEEDLNFIYDNYYVDKFNFAWPETDIL